MVEPFKAIDPRKASPEEIAAGLALLNKKKEYEHKVKTGEVKGAKKWADLSEPEKEKARAYGKRIAMRQKLLNAKAAKAGISVSEAEIQAELKAVKK